MKARTIHRWLGIPLCFFLILASLSGILLNHRDLLRSIDIPRSWMPSSYQYTQWNNGAMRGQLTHRGQHYIYGTAGIWKYKDDSSTPPAPTSYNQGIHLGADERKIVAMELDSKGGIWAASQYRLYRLSASEDCWQSIPLPSSLEERIADLYIHADTLLLLSRSLIYSKPIDSDEDWTPLQLRRSDDHQEGILLFQLIWALHSGEYGGWLGRIIVDLVGVMIIQLCITGIYYTIVKSKLRSVSKPNSQPRQSPHLPLWRKRLGQTLKLHNRWGRKWLYALLFVCISGWMLRPPLMLALLHHRVTPWRISHLHSDNPWHNRLRGIRYDRLQKHWLISTSVGFYTLLHLQSKPIRWSAQPPMSPMGINAFYQRPDGTWLIGSFSGMYIVSPSSKIYNYFTGEPIVSTPKGRPIGTHLVAGIALPQTGKELIALYDHGLVSRSPSAPLYISPSPYIKQAKELDTTSISLWQLALEVHTGRIYAPIIGSLGVDLFIFVLGLCSVLVLITGYRRKKSKGHQPKHSQ